MTRIIVAIGVFSVCAFINALAQRPTINPDIRLRSHESAVAQMAADYREDATEHLSGLPNGFQCQTFSTRGWHPPEVVTIPTYQRVAVISLEPPVWSPTIINVAQKEKAKKKRD